MTAGLMEPTTKMDAEPMTRLNQSCNGLEMSPEEFDAISDWDAEFQYELIRGVVIVSPIPLEGEIDPNEQLGHLLRTYQEQHAQGKTLDKTLPERYVYLPDGSRRRADRVIWTGLGRKPQPKLDVPSIVVEFVSASKRDHLRDYLYKRREHHALGVKEYWVINRFNPDMTVFRPEGEVRVQRDEIYRTVLLPGFEMPLGQLLAIAEEWTDQ
jgi:Uma2 family endonuclease